MTALNNNQQQILHLFALTLASHTNHQHDQCSQERAQASAHYASIESANLKPTAPTKRPNHPLTPAKQDVLFWGTVG
ncbi:MAG: hypothetical protein IPP56_16535 [Bacteroidetes bacterium]|nr:hypothetical protein [Bacteroidota bacterium]MBK9801253.1 hypothetical protein [Bacteroidota bacterium]